jgi:hypothetical protein
MTSFSKAIGIVALATLVLASIGCGSAPVTPEKDPNAASAPPLKKGGAATNAAVGDNGTDAVAGPGDKTGTPK